MNHYQLGIHIYSNEWLYSFVGRCYCAIGCWRPDPIDPKKKIVGVVVKEDLREKKKCCFVVSNTFLMKNTRAYGNVVYRSVP